MGEFWKKHPNRAKWLLFALAVAGYSCLILTMMPEKQAEELAIPETTAAYEETQAPAAEPPEEAQETTAPIEEVSLPWNLLLVNPWNPLPQYYEAKLTRLEDGQVLDSRVVPDMEAMLSAMRKENLRPYIVSSFRTDEKQQTLYRNKVEQYLNQGYSLAEADEEAGKWVAVPGTSEHQTGLAADIVDASYPYLNEKQENTKAQKWLMAHSWEYGFILRYPSEKSDITGIYYEPWHYRYVGKEAAKEIYEQGICLEEYLEMLG